MFIRKYDKATQNVEIGVVWGLGVTKVIVMLCFLYQSVNQSINQFY